MAQYTITTLSILKSLAKTKLDLDYEFDFNSVHDFVEQTADLVFDQYPIFDEAYRHRLNVKIVSHFLFEETNVTPYQRWHFMINRKMREIMPYYNELYKSALFDFDPLADTNIVETIARELDTDTLTESARQQAITGSREIDSQRSVDSQSISETSEDIIADGTSKTWQSDTPYNRQNSAKDWASELGEEDTEGQTKTESTGTLKDQQEHGFIEEMGTHEDMSAESSTDQKTQSQEDILKIIKGKRSGISFNTLLKEYRQNILNIDMMIIDELEVLFRFILN